MEGFIMADISKELYNIKSAIFGKDVRGSIHDGINAINQESERSSSTTDQTKARQDVIEQRYNEAIAGLTDDSEVIDSRVDVDGNTFALLKERLDYEQRQTKVLSGVIRKGANASTPLIVPTYDGNQQTVHPKVVYVENGWNGYKYWMAHTPYPSSNDKFENPSISVSNDGVTWIDPVGIVNPIDIPSQAELNDAYHMSDTHLLLVDGVLECWYRFNKNNVIDQIFRKRSTDGVNWGVREVMHTLNGSDMTLSPAIVRDEGKYKMWYVTGDFKVIYKESTDGVNWSPAQVCTVTSDKSYRHWHLDVIKDNGEYEILLASGDPALTLANDRKVLLHGISDSPTNFALTEIMAPPSYDSGAWDAYYLYRACITKVGSFYRIYYSARSVDNRWHIGLSQGENINALVGYTFDLNSNADLSNVNDVKPRRDVIVNQGQKVYTHASKISYIDNKEVKLVNPGVSGARLVTEKKDTVRVKNDAGTLPGDIEVHHIILNSLDPSVSVSDGYISVNAGLRINGTSDSKTVRTKYVIDGVRGAAIGIGTRANAIQVTSDNGLNSGTLEANGVIFDTTLSVPAVEGVIRYNPTLKKHEGYNGTSWNALY